MKYVAVEEVTLVNNFGVEHTLPAGQVFIVEPGGGITLLEHPVVWLTQETQERRVTLMSVSIGRCLFEEFLESRAIRPHA